MPRRLTVADVLEVTGYSRDELHALLRVLHPYVSEKSAPRVAREFSPKDLVVLSVTQALEQAYGMRRTAVAELGEKLQAALSGPRLASGDAKLCISIRPPKVEYLENGSSVAEGLVVALAPIFDKVDRYLSFEPQMSLQLGPSLLTRRYR